MARGSRTIPAGDHDFFQRSCSVIYAKARKIPTKNWDAEKWPPKSDSVVIIWKEILHEPHKFII